MTQSITQAWKIWIATVAAEVAFFLSVGIIWFLFFAETVHVWWLLLSILPFHFLAAGKRKEKCRCPHCRSSLPGFDGDDIYSSQCPHCGREF